jgi:hypothetical protein
MKFIVIISLIFLLISCKSSKSQCDAYTQIQIKKDHQI